MSKMIQIRNVPDELHRTLKSRAAAAGMTLSDYLMKELRQVAERPPFDEVYRRIQSQPARVKPFDTAKAVRAVRESRR